MGLMKRLRKTELARQINLPSPCPEGNGTKYTSPETQDFTLFCGLSSNTNSISTSSTQTFSDCMNLCSTTHLPRCGGVSFFDDSKTCQLYPFLDERTLEATAEQGQGIVDSARALFPTASSDCRVQGAQVVAAGNMSFTPRCGRVIDGSDLQQRHAPSYRTCLETCAGTPGCKAVSFEASQFAGFNNCYLKSAAGGAGTRIFVNLEIDSGVVVPPVQSEPTSSPGTVTITAVLTSVTITATQINTVATTAGFVSTPNPLGASAPTATAGSLSELESAAGPSPSGGRTITVGLGVAILIGGAIAILTVIATIAVLLVKRRRRRRREAIEARNVAAYWPRPPEEPTFEDNKESQPKSKAPMGNVTVVSTSGQVFERDELDPDGRREWWKRGASPRGSVADST